jgi:Predicted membrane protein
LRLRLERRELIRNVATLGPAIDEAIGESTELRYRTRALQAAVDGLFSALAGWRTVANHLEHASDQNQRDIDEVAARLPGELRAISPAANPIALCQICRTAARELFVMRCTSPSEQLMADHSAKAMTGLAAAFDGLALLTNPRGPAPRSRVARVRVPDWLPSIVNAVRILFTLVAVELFWIWTAWPNGAFAIAFAAITVILLAPIQDEAAAAAQTFLYGCALAMVLAAIIGFAVLPKMDTFVGFCPRTRGGAGADRRAVRAALERTAVYDHWNQLHPDARAGKSGDLRHQSFLQLVGRDLRGCAFRRACLSADSSPLAGAAHTALARAYAA